jgi:hypothetical protein
MVNQNVATMSGTDIAKLQAELAQAQAENAKLKANLDTVKATGIKVSAKGGVSIYGLGRFPVTLYKEQWLKLLDMADTIRGFIDANAAKLSTKPSKE